MSTLDLDLEVLTDDYDRLVALEGLGVKPDFPAVCAIRQRWCLTDDGEDMLVARESREAMERAQFMTDTDPRAGIHRAAGRITAKAVKGAGKLVGAGLGATAKGAGKLSKKLALRFYDFAEALAKEQADRLKEITSKAAFMERKLNKLKTRMSLLDDHKTLAAVDVHTSSWTSKVCFEDRPDFEACVKFSKQTNAYEGVVQKYTVYTRTALKKSKAFEGPGLKQISKSTNWAVKRAAGLLGIIDPFKKVEAFPVPGNIVVVEHHSGKVSWAIARDGEYGETIKSLDMHQCGKAIEAVEALIKSIAARGTKNRVVGYTGIYEEVEAMKSELKNLEGDELKEATLRYRNAMAMEDAFTTALVRVAEGLMEWTKQSLAEVN